ncbi:MAG: hypothetical protein HYX66_07645 [Ignavibacteria bacterium]|nr:hypothetical protein [Ignavibacteria bacterium]
MNQPSHTIPMKTALTFLFCLLLAPISSQAHGGHKHNEEIQTNVQASPTATKSDSMPGEHDHQAMMQEQSAGMKHDESKVTANFDEFPSLHPLIVHFAIVLIVVAAGMQLLNVLLVKQELAWIITLILFVGVLTAWIAANNLHPHTDGLNAHAKLVLEEHDKWADWTIYSGIVALVLQGANLFVYKGKRWASGVVGIVLVISAISVSLAGHHGSQLTHIEGIGPQGKFLEMDHN